MLTIVALLAAVWLVAGVIVVASTTSPSRAADIALAERTPVTSETSAAITLSEATTAA